MLSTLVVMVPSSGQAASPLNSEPRQRVLVDVRGPLAVVTVERPLTFGAEALRAPSDEVVVDLDLPEGARLEWSEVMGPAGDRSARALRLDPTAGGDGDPRRTYLATLDAVGARRSRVAIDDGADFRLTVAASGIGQGRAAAHWSLRYRFVAPLACRDGELLLAMPGSLDPAPAPADVTVRLQAPGWRLARVGPGATGAPPTAPTPGNRSASAAPPAGGPRVGRPEEVATAAPWDIVLSPASRMPARPERPRFQLVSATGRGSGSDSVLAAGLCRPPVSESSWRPPATRLVLLMDRSRSMGPGGAASARDLVRAVALALPPSLTFNAIVFDRAAESLFPLARSATLEALAALGDALGMGSLRNGTALAPALRRASTLLASDPELRGQPTYVVVVTDGALAEGDRGGALAESARALSSDRLETAVVILRSEEDERPAVGDLRVLASIPGRTGGILRELGPRAVAESGARLVADLRAGGDLLDPRVESPRVTGEFERSSVAPGGGTQLLGKVGPSTGGVAGPVRVRATYQGRAVTLTSQPARLERSTAAALLAARPTARVATGAGVAALVTPVGAQDPALAAAPRGQMDRDVVHKALAYAYLPRARACYLTRSIKSAQDFQLRGRLRLELHLERGEMVGADVKRSTLGRPDIEACLREAAFSVEIPRALSNDAPVLAVLNLVLRPRTDARPPDASAESTTLSSQIDRLLPPPGPSTDPMELLVEP